MQKIKTFNKLVRDKIPEIIKNNGGNPEFEILKDNIYLQKLKEKLKEESQEVADAQNREEVLQELADVMEIVLSIAKEYNINIDEIEKSRVIKNQHSGSFDSKIFLKSSTVIKNF